MNCEQFVSSLFTKHADVFPALCGVASAAAVLPVTNASPEQGIFNPEQDFDKAAEPTLEGTLDQLMRICIEGPPSSQMDFAGLCSCGDLSEPAAFYELVFGAHGKLSLRLPAYV